MRLGRNRASCAHDALYTVWQQTDFRPAAEGTDGKQTHEQWQSADLRHAERWMSSCAPTGCCWTCAWMHAWVECMYRNTNTHVHTRTHTHTHNRARAHEHSWRHRVLTWVALTRTCHHLHSTSTISMNVNFSVSHRQRGTMICVCMCVLPNLLPHSYYTEDALPRHPCISIPSWPTPSWETEICECMLRRSTL